MKASSPRGSGSAAAKRSKNLGDFGRLQAPAGFSDLLRHALPPPTRLPSLALRRRGLYIPAMSDPAAEPVLFDALLTPHRSLSPRGFALLMAIAGLVGFGFGAAFLVHGRLAHLRLLRRRMAAVLCLLPPQLPRGADARAGAPDAGPAHRRAPRSPRARSSPGASSPIGSGSRWTIRRSMGASFPSPPTASA